MALKYILEAWEEALVDGIDNDALVTASIFTALSDMVQSYGEEPVAKMAEGLRDRILTGEFTLNKVTQ